MKIEETKRVVPVKIRVFREEKFQNTVAADPITTFLCEQASHASNNHCFTASTVKI